MGKMHFQETCKSYNQEKSLIDISRISCNLSNEKCLKIKASIFLSIFILPIVNKNVIISIVVKVNLYFSPLRVYDFPPLKIKDFILVLIIKYRVKSFFFHTD